MAALRILVGYRHGDSAARAGMDPNERVGDYTALDMALREQHFVLAKLLIQGGADPGIALRAVARYGNQELFDLVLSRKPKPNDLVGGAPRRRRDWRN